MSYINKSYPEKEIAILTVNHEKNRAKRGDIVVMRNPHNVIGVKERADYLWLRIEGWEEDAYWSIHEPNFDAHYSNDEGTIAYDKRRYCIPFHRLKEVYSLFDIARAENISDEYQPFMIIDEDNGAYLTPQKPYSIHGLVYDKVFREYL